MKIKTPDLTGAALDWAVARAEGVYFENLREFEDYALNYCTDWEHGGPLIEREGIALYLYGGSEWNAHVGGKEIIGPTPLIAAMRCYVASKMGDTVDIPDELTNQGEASC